MSASPVYEQRATLGKAAPNVAIDLALLAVVAAIFLAGAGIFAANQSIWVDETTQMSGLALPLPEMFRWLLGAPDLAAGVPPDRMPPLSYLLGKLWMLVFGPSETAMRWFGIIAVLLSLPALYLSGRQVGGRLGSLFVAAFVLCSPATMMIAGEIRAYPVLICLASWAALYFVRLTRQPDGPTRTQDLAWLVVFLVLAAYTHFFGVVMAGAILLSLAAGSLSSRKRLVGILVASAVTVILLLGLIPFIQHALTVGSGDPTAGPIEGGAGIAGAAAATARLAFRLLFSPVLLATPIALYLGVAALALLVAIGLWRRFRPVATEAKGSGWPRPRLETWTLAAPLILSLAGLLVLKTRITSFDVLSPSYNLWLVPLAATTIVVVAEAALRGATARLLVALLMAVVVATGLVGVKTLLDHPTLYSHGPAVWLQKQVAVPASTLLIYDAADPWGHLYFPAFYLTDGAIEQWLDTGGSYSRITETALDPVASPSAELKRFSAILRVRAGYLDSAELASVASGATSCDSAAPSPAAGADRGAVFCAMVAARVTPFTP